MDKFVLVIDNYKLYVFEMMDETNAEIFKIRGNDYDEIDLEDPEYSAERIKNYLLDTLNYNDFSNCSFNVIYNDVDINVIHALMGSFSTAEDFEVNKLENSLVSILLKSNKINLGETQVVNFYDSSWKIELTEDGLPNIMETNDEYDIQLTVEDIPAALFSTYSFTTDKDKINSLKNNLDNQNKKIDELNKNLKDKEEKINSLEEKKSKKETKSNEKKEEYFLKKEIEEILQVEGTVFRGNLNNTNVFPTEGIKEFNEVKRNIKTEGDKVLPIIVDDKILFSSRAALRAVNINNGNELWKTDIELTTIPIYKGDTLYCGVETGYSESDELYAIDITTGEVEWKYKTEENKREETILSTPIIYDGIIYFISVGCSIKEGGMFSSDEKTTDRYNFHAVNIKTGIEKYKFRITDRSGDYYSKSFYNDSNSDLIIHNDMIYFGLVNHDRDPYECYLYAVDCKTGEIESKWIVPQVDEIKRVMKYKDKVYFLLENWFAQHDASLCIINPKNFNEINKFEFRNGIINEELISIYNDKIYYYRKTGDNIPALISQGLEDGEVKWIHNVDGHISSNPLIAEGLLYYIEYHNDTNSHFDLYALDTETGEKLWEFEVQGEKPWTGHFADWTGHFVEEIPLIIYKGEVYLVTKDKIHVLN